MKRSWLGIVVGCALALLGMALNASAQSPPEAVVKCETRVNPQRVKINVNGDNLGAGTFFAVITKLPTGPTATSGTATANADGEADFEFNSNLSSDAPEAAITPIAGGFAEANDVVMGTILTAATTPVVVASGTATCANKP